MIEKNNTHIYIKYIYKYIILYVINQVILTTTVWKCNYVIKGGVIFTFAQDTDKDLASSFTRIWI